jgi:hypothetical protein
MHLFRRLIGAIGVSPRGGLHWLAPGHIDHIFRIFRTRNAFQRSACDPRISQLSPVELSPATS